VRSYFSGTAAWLAPLTSAQTKVLRRLQGNQFKLQESRLLFASLTEDLVEVHQPHSARRQPAQGLGN
jgi:hypothetical protein